MTRPRPFRFGFTGGVSSKPQKLLDSARAVEALGYSTYGLADHFVRPFAPLIAGQAVADATHELRITVRNSGRLPTALEQAKRVKAVRPDQFAIRAARGSTTRIAGRTPEFYLNGGETRTVTLRVKSGGKPEDQTFTLRALSTRGGVAEREVRLGS